MNGNGTKTISVTASIWIAAATLLIGVLVGVLADMTATSQRFVSIEQYRIDQQRTEQQLRDIDRKLDKILHQQTSR